MRNLKKFKRANTKYFVLALFSYYALSTLPERKQRVQMFTRCGVPSIVTLIRCKLGFQMRLLCLLECETELPETTPFLHTKHSFAIIVTSHTFHYNCLSNSDYCIIFFSNNAIRILTFLIKKCKISKNTIISE